MFQPAPIPAHIFPAPVKGPIIDEPVLERSPPPLGLGRPPAPLMARRSYPLERGDAVMNPLPEPSPAASLQFYVNLPPSLVPCLRALSIALTIYVMALAYALVARTI
jgi:hypothetical protein